MEQSQLGIRFKPSQVTHIAGVEQVRLQGWLQRGNIYLDAIAGRPGRYEHLAYSFLDALRIALIGRLLSHGMDSAKEASGLVERLIGGTYGSADRAKALRRGDFSVIEHAELDSLGAFWTLTGDTRMYVWRTDEGKWDFAWGCLPGGYTASDGTQIQHGEIFGMSGAHPSERPDTYVFIHVGNIIVDMVARVAGLGFIPKDFPAVTAEDLAKNPLYEGYTTEQLTRTANSHTINNAIHFILTKENL